MANSKQHEVVCRERCRTPSFFNIIVHLVAATGLLVHLLGVAEPALSADKPKSERAFLGELPGNVAEMRESILSAAKSGRIEELKTAIEWNELKPDFGIEAGVDPIIHWKKLSADGEGRDMLAALVTMLEMPPHRLAIGPDAENAGVFVWPYVAELPIDGLQPAEEVDVLRLMPYESYKALRSNKKWAWWRLAISADGTWLMFRKYE